MGYEWIATAAAAAASGIGAVAGQHPAKSRRYAKELAQFNNDLAVENWKMQNAYDSPAAQMQRYQEAGLNPNLIYGQQNTGGTIQSGSASFDADSMVPNEGKAVRGIADAIATYQNIRSMQIQNQNANLVGDLTREDIKAKQLSNQVSESIMPYLIEGKALGVQDQTFKVMYQNIATYNKTLREIDTEIEKAINLRSKTKVSDRTYDKLGEDIENLKKQREVMQAQVDSAYAKIYDMQQTLPFRQGLYQAQATSAYASSENAYQNATGKEISNKIAAEYAEDKEVAAIADKIIGDKYMKIPIMGASMNAEARKAFMRDYKKVKNFIKSNKKRYGISK